MKWWPVLLVAACASSTSPQESMAPVAKAGCEASACVEACASADDAEACALACDAGDGSSCIKAAAIAMEAQDAAAAMQHFNRGCEVGQETACEAAKALAPLVEPPETCAPEDLEACVLACRRGDALSCRHLALAYDSGAGVAQDSGEAQRWFEIGCTLGDQPSCDRANAIRAGMR